MTNNNDDGLFHSLPIESIHIQIKSKFQIKSRSSPDATNGNILLPPFLFSISHTPVVQQKEEEDGNDHQQQQG